MKRCKDNNQSCKVVFTLGTFAAVPNLIAIVPSADVGLVSDSLESILILFAFITNVHLEHNATHHIFFIFVVFWRYYAHQWTSSVSCKIPLHSRYMCVVESNDCHRLNHMRRLLFFLSTSCVHIHTNHSTVPVQLNSDYLLQVVPCLLP